MAPPVTKVDALIVTAVGLERAAIRAHLKDVHQQVAGTLSLDIGTLPVVDGITVAVVETGAGNVAAATSAADALAAIPADWVVMVGVAGGVKDVAIGDVVVASKVYWIEGGKDEDPFLPRPDFAPVSTRLIQAARAIRAEDQWRAMATSGSSKRIDGLPAEVLVAPVVCGEKIHASRRSALARLVRETYGDAVAVDMEDFGVLRAAASDDLLRAVAVRGVSDLLDGKAASDAAGSQPLAAANAAAFALALLARVVTDERARAPVGYLAGTGHEVGSDATAASWRQLHRALVELYPTGPLEENVWDRAGGTVARLVLRGSGSALWWGALRMIRQGGGGQVSAASLVGVMREDFPESALIPDPMEL